MAKKNKEVPNVNTATEGESFGSQENIGGAYPPWRLNVFDLDDLDLKPEPSMGDWISYACGGAILISVVEHVNGAKVYLRSGCQILAQDIIEIR